MGETKASNGVSANKKKRVNAGIKEVSMEEINKNIRAFTDGNELYVDSVVFESTPERITTQEGDSGNNGDTANASKPVKAGDYTRVDASGSKPLSDVLKDGIIIKVKKDKTKTKDAEKNEKENIDDAQK